MKKTNIIVIALFLSFFLSFEAFSQLPPDGEEETPGCWPPPCVPIDGGIVFLIAAGAAYGSKKIYDFKKQH
jgi:hypothetical protein